MKLIAGYIGLARDFKPIFFIKENAYQDAHPSRHKDIKSKKSISKNTSANKTNYSTVCRRCGRKLRSEASRNRGYGSYCYNKVVRESSKDIEEQTFEELDQ